MEILMFLFPLLGVFCAASFSWKSKETAIPKFTINLDLPPEQRYEHVCRRYAHLMPLVHQNLQYKLSAIPLLERNRILQLVRDPELFMPSEYAREIRGIVTACNSTLTDIVLWNFIYELVMSCTGIVTQDSEGIIWHARNMDTFNHLELLRPVQVEYTYRKNGKLLFTFTGQVGGITSYTAVKPGVFTVNTNARFGKKNWGPLIRALKGEGYLLGFFIRDLLMEATSFADAVRRTETALFSSRHYVILGGILPGEGAVITRDTEATVDVLYLNQTNDGWFLVQTNYDHWNKPPEDDDRRTPAIRSIKRIGQKEMSPRALYSTMSTPPVLNQATSRTIIMRAKEPIYYRSMTRDYHN